MMFIELCAKIIDFEKKGNVIRFYLNDHEECPDYWGDDWDDKPYEHNAGTVYDEFVTHIMDVAFPLDCNVLAAEDDWRYNGNSPYSKEDFKNRHAPCIIVLPPEIIENDCVQSDSYSHYKASEQVYRFYFNDEVEVIKSCKYATILKFDRKEFFRK